MCREDYLDDWAVTGLGMRKMPYPQTDCKGRTNTTLSALRAASDTIGFSDISTIFYRCDLDGACIGGLVDEQCREGHRGSLCNLQGWLCSGSGCV